MKSSMYKSYDELPLFLSVNQGSRRSPAKRVRREEEAQQNERVFAVLGGNEGYGACADEVAKTLGVAPSSAYELMHEPGFPTLRIGNRMVVPKEKFISWVEEHSKGGDRA